MIYTIGCKDSYEEAFATSPKPVQKIGKSEDYQGGIVFQTPEDAARHLSDYNRDGYNVYGVEAAWGEQTYPDPKGGPWHYLLVDADLVQIPQPIL